MFFSGETTPKNDLSIYERYAHEWWDTRSPRFRSLHGISKFRRELLDRWIPYLETKTIVDLGCGGGLLSAPLSTRGARVIGVDLSASSLARAREHSSASARYICADIRRVPLPSGIADVVILADVLDHIADYGSVLREARRLLRQDGVVFINTINRNALSELLAVTIGERIGLVPKGTHDPQLFIRPAELRREAEQSGFLVIEWQGERPAIVKTIRSWAIHFAPTANLSIAYSALLSPRVS